MPMELALTCILTRIEMRQQQEAFFKCCRQMEGGQSPSELGSSDEDEESESSEEEESEESDEFEEDDEPVLTTLSPRGSKTNQGWTCTD